MKHSAQETDPYFNSVLSLVDAVASQSDIPKEEILRGMLRGLLSKLQQTVPAQEFQSITTECFSIIPDGGDK